MRLKLYSRRQLEKDKFLYGKFYLYDLWIFTLRLNPKKVIEGTDGLPNLFGMDVKVDKNTKSSYLFGW